MMIDPLRKKVEQIKAELDDIRHEEFLLEAAYENAIADLNQAERAEIEAAKAKAKE